MQHKFLIVSWPRCFNTSKQSSSKVPLAGFSVMSAEENILSRPLFVTALCMCVLFSHAMFKQTCSSQRYEGTSEIRGLYVAM